MIKFQAGVSNFMACAFRGGAGTDKLTRAYRFLEESLELSQTVPGFSKTDAHKLVEYVFSRPVGEPAQEVGGTMLTLAALCNAMGVDLNDAANAELMRVFQPAVIAKIQRKQAEKMPVSPLPDPKWAQEYAAAIVAEYAQRAQPTARLFDIYDFQVFLAGKLS